jgi:hypothetical protein
MAKPFKAKMPAVPTKRAPKSTTSGVNLKTLRVGTKRKR